MLAVEPIGQRGYTATGLWKWHKRITDFCVLVFG